MGTMNNFVPINLTTAQFWPYNFVLFKVVLASLVCLHLFIEESVFWPKPTCNFFPSQLQSLYLVGLMGESCPPHTRPGAQPVHCSI